MAWLTKWFSSEQKEPKLVEKETPLREAAGAQNVDAEMDGFRPISGDMNRNLSPLTQARMRKVAASLWEQNLLANRLIEIPLAYLLAEGVSLSHENETHKDTLDRFWNHPINNMDMKLEKRLRELGLFGELFIPAFVNEQTGAVRLSYLDVEVVKEVIFDPDNPEQAIGVITHRDKKGNYKKYKVIINGDEDDCFTDNTVAIREQFTDGELFYFAINTIGAKPRGRSDLLAQADYLDIYDHMLYGEADRIDFLRAFVWHFKIEGADQTEIDSKWKKTFSKPPAPSSTLVTNEKVTMEAKSPSLNASETDTSARLFRNHILGGGTVPEQIFGGGGDVNRSTGETMMEPFEKVLTMRQKVAKEIITSFGIYVLRQKIFATGGAEPDLDDDIYDLTVTMPEMTAKDTTKYAAALQQVVTACQIAERAEYLTKTEAMKLIDAIAGRLGVDIDTTVGVETDNNGQPKPANVASEDDVFSDETDDAA
jgi:hypothetical protein